jgi:hypothetical protein
MNMLGHDDVAEDLEVVTFSREVVLEIGVVK